MAESPEEDFVAGVAGVAGMAGVAGVVVEAGVAGVAGVAGDAEEELLLLEELPPLAAQSVVDGVIVTVTLDVGA